MPALPAPGRRHRRACRRVPVAVIYELGGLLSILRDRDQPVLVIEHLVIGMLAFHALGYVSIRIVRIARVACPSRPQGCWLTSPPLALTASTIESRCLPWRGWSGVGQEVLQPRSRSLAARIPPWQPFARRRTRGYDIHMRNE